MLFQSPHLGGPDSLISQRHLFSHIIRTLYHFTLSSFFIIYDYISKFKTYSRGRAAGLVCLSDLTVLISKSNDQPIRTRIFQDGPNPHFEFTHRFRSSSSGSFLNESRYGSPRSVRKIVAGAFSRSLLLRFCSVHGRSGTVRPGRRASTAMSSE